MRRALRFFVIAMLLMIVVGAAIRLSQEPASVTKDPQVTQTQAVKMSVPVDLTGEWRSVEGSKGKMIATIKDNTIHVEMVDTQSFIGLWYGTFDILQSGQKEMISKAIDDPKHFVLSSAKTKAFLYQNDSLVFDYSVMGVRTTVEMKRA